MSSNNRQLVAGFYSSARLIESHFAEYGQAAAQTVGHLNHSFMNGGGYGQVLMAQLARWALLSGAVVTSVPTDGLKLMEGNDPYSIALYTPNIFRRMQALQEAPDFFDVEIGGAGSIQEFFDNDDHGIEYTPHAPRPCLISNPYVPQMGECFYDQMISHVRMEVDLGIRPKSSLDRLRLSYSPAEKAEQIHAVQHQFDRMKDTDWRDWRRGRMQYVEEKSGVLHLPSGNCKLEEHMLVPKEDLVAIISTSAENTDLNPRFKGLIENTIPSMMDELQRMGKKVICVNSTNGINAHILTAAARRGILHMALSTKADETQRHQVYHDIPVAVFDGRQQMAGYMHRKCGTMMCLPGATTFLADHLCDVSIFIQNRPMFVLVDPDGYYDKMMAQYKMMGQPLFARDHNGQPIGVASTERLLKSILTVRHPNDWDHVYKTMRGELPFDIPSSGYRHEIHKDPHMEAIMKAVGELQMPDKPESWDTMRQILFHPPGRRSAAAKHLLHAQERARRIYSRVKTRA